MSPDRVLYLLRHAKSSWDDPGLEDHARALAPRGRRAVGRLAEHIRAAGIAPQFVLCSTARRARETLDGLDPPGERLLEDGLYGASPGTLLDRLHELPDEVTSAMVIGHNPTMQALTLRLASGKGRHQLGGELAEVQRKFPTGALATLSFTGSWPDLAPGRATLVAFIRPRQLERR